MRAVGRSVVASLVVRSGVGEFSFRSSGGMARGVPIVAWCGILGVNDTTLLQVAGMVLRAGFERRCYVGMKNATFLYSDNYRKMKVMYEISILNCFVHRKLFHGSG
jgi:hypothetical protein